MSDFSKLPKGLQKLIDEARERRKPRIVQWWNKTIRKHKQT